MQATDMKPEVTMTTREIAEMTGKDHRNVLRDADRMIAAVREAQRGQLKSERSSGDRTQLKSEQCSKSEQPESRGPTLGCQGGHLRFEVSLLGVTEGTYKDGRNATRRMLVLNKHAVFTLITGYDTALRFAVVGRWIELEQAANPAFNAQSIAETLTDLQSRVDMMAPAYKEHVRKGTSGSGILIDEAARMVGLTGPVVRAWFLHRKVIQRRTVGQTVEGAQYAYTPSSRFIDLGLGKDSRRTIKHGGDKYGLKLTLKGVEWLRSQVAEVTAWDTQRKAVKVHTDADGFVVAVTGEGTEGKRLDQL
ncbi:Rha family transcriptional regulator [Pseudomonas sp. NY15463]|uniref:Rha family transcriptional regulator n=1 Tax=Pseudomonas sp. NY15463 TaxID=3400361 RepID=UPI003A880B6E